MRLQLRISYKIPYYDIEKLQKSYKFQNITYCLTLQCLEVKSRFLTFTKESNDFLRVVQIHVNSIRFNRCSQYAR